MGYIYASMNCVCIGSDNGLSPVWLQAIILTNAVLLSISIRLLGTIFSEILLKNMGGGGGVCVHV